MKISLVRSDKSDVRFLLLLSIFLVSAIFPSRRFIFVYSLGFKIYFLSLIFLSLVFFLKNKIKAHSTWVTGITVLFIGFSLNSIFADYPVRATSELDIFLAASAISYLFYTHVKTNSIRAFRSIGILFFAITSFSLWVYAGSEPPYPFAYNWTKLWENTFGHPLRFLQILTRGNANRYPFEYSNFTGVFATITLPFMVGLFFYDLSKKWRIFWLVSFLFGIIELITADSRAAYLLVLFGLLVGLLLYLKTKAKFSFRQTLFAVCAMVILSATVVFFNSDVRNIFNDLFKGNIGSILGIRWNLTQEGWRLFLEKPFTGHGIDTTGLLYFRTLPVNPFPSWQLHAPMQYLVDWGLIGTFGLLIIALSVACMWYRLFFKTSSRDKILATACLISFILYALFVSDWSLDIFSICVSLCLIVSTLYFLYKKHFLRAKHLSSGTTIWLSRGIKCLAVILFAQLLTYSVKDIRGRYFFSKGVNSTDLSKSEVLINKALEADPKNYYYYNQLGNIFALHAPNSKTALAKALCYFNCSLEINPYQIYPLENLGALYTISNNYELAYECYYKAICLNPRRSLAYIQLAHLLYLNHFYDLGDQWAALACFANPKLIQYAPLTGWLEKNLKVQSQLFDLYRQAEKTSNSKQEQELLKCDEFFFRHLLDGNECFKFQLSYRRTRAAISRLLMETNVKLMSLPYLHQYFDYMYQAYSPFAYPEDIIFMVPEKIRMHNIEGPTLNIYTPCPIYFHPKLVDYAKYFDYTYSYNKSIIHDYLKEAYKNPFQSN